MKEENAPSCVTGWASTSMSWFVVIASYSSSNKIQIRQIRKWLEASSFDHVTQPKRPQVRHVMIWPTLYLSKSSRYCNQDIKFDQEIRGSRKHEVQSTEAQYWGHHIEARTGTQEGTVRMPGELKVSAR